MGNEGRRDWMIERSITPRARGWEWRFVLLGLLAILLAACSGSTDLGGLFRDSGSEAQPPQIPTGGKKVALLLPLSASGETQRIAGSG